MYVRGKSSTVSQSPAMFSHIHSLSESSKRSPDIYQDKSFNHGRLFNLSGSWGKKKNCPCERTIERGPSGCSVPIKDTISLNSCSRSCGDLTLILCLNQCIYLWRGQFVRIHFLEGLSEQLFPQDGSEVSSHDRLLLHGAVVLQGQDERVGRGLGDRDGGEKSGRKGLVSMEKKG